MWQVKIKYAEVPLTIDRLGKDSDDATYQTPRVNATIRSDSKSRVQTCIQHAKQLHNTYLYEFYSSLAVTPIAS